MYIYPNTDLKILRNVNLNNDYDHTIYFSGKTAQTEYFLSKAKYTLTNQQYQRKERGWIQVNINQNDLWDCTYIMYRNTSYNTKWFYAFILSVDYVNDSVSRINFEIDVIQTWHFDYTLDKCYVEREHTISDNLFENTVQENIDIGLSYYKSLSSARQLFDNSRLLIMVATDKDNNAYSPRLEKNVFTGLRYRTFDLKDNTGLTLAIQFITDMIGAGLEDNIVNIMQYPRFIGQLESDVNGFAYEDYQFVGNFTSIDGYTPQNKKLFCYPYNYLLVTDNEGQDKEYKWEMWGASHQGKFTLEGCGYGRPVVRIVPRYYKTSNYTHAYSDALVYDNFPICPWVGDSYQVWLAQNKNQFMANAATQIFNSAVTGAYGAATANPLTTLRGVGNLLTSISGSLGQIQDAKYKSQKTHGEPTTSLLAIQNETAGFELKQMAIPFEYAMIIDEYFSRFGYACCRVKIPNRNARQNWTYTKTIGCEINGNVPSDDINKIKNVYDHGITFWNNGDNIGEYNGFYNPVYT